MILLKPATLPKVALLHGCFSRFLNCTNGTKSRKFLKSHMIKRSFLVQVIINPLKFGVH